MGAHITACNSPFITSDDDDVPENLNSQVIVHINSIPSASEVRSMGQVYRKVGTGAFNVGVEVYGPEYNYGVASSGSGIFRSRPTASEDCQYRESIFMGNTELTAHEVRVIVDKMGKSWTGGHYDLLQNNCSNFADALCVKLGVGNVPSWVLNLAGAGATVTKGFRGPKNRVEAAAIIAAAKKGEIDDKYLLQPRCRTCGLTSVGRWCGGRGKLSRDKQDDFVPK